MDNVELQPEVVGVSGDYAEDEWSSVAELNEEVRRCLDAGILKLVDRKHQAY